MVAADDGIMPQTREHLAILDLLGLSRGLVALTKADLADEARRREVIAEITATLAGTCLSGVSSPWSTARISCRDRKNSASPWPVSSPARSTNARTTQKARTTSDRVDSRSRTTAFQRRTLARVLAILRG